jgi:uncharacterized protein
MTPASPRPIAHLELHTPDGARAGDFYSELLGWRQELVDAGGRSYLALDLGEGPGGGIVECGAERGLWLPYVTVSHVDEATERAHRLGATVLLQPTEGPAGWRSVIASPAIGEIAFWQSKAWRPETYDASSPSCWPPRQRRGRRTLLHAARRRRDVGSGQAQPACCASVSRPAPSGRAWLVALGRRGSPTRRSCRRAP